MAVNESNVDLNYNKYQKDDTAYKIIRAALTFMATKGYNSFSIKDITDKLGITKSTIYYHFKSKELIGLEALKLRGFRIECNMLDQKERNPPSSVKIKEFFDYFFKVNDRNICPGTFLSVDFKNIPESIRDELKRIFDGIINYLEEILIEGKDHGVFFFKDHPRDRAEQLFSIVEGTLIVATARKDQKMYDRVTKQMLYSLEHEEN